VTLPHCWGSSQVSLCSCIMVVGIDTIIMPCSVYPVDPLQQHAKVA
jgi:hypothetical protein